MLTIRIILLLSIAACIGWYLSLPGYEPVIVAMTSIVALIGTFYGSYRRQMAPTQQQSVAKNALGIQAGRDVSIGSINGTDERKDD